MRTKIGLGCKDLTEGCPRLFSFHYRPFFFFVYCKLILYVLGPDWKRCRDGVGCFLTPLVWLM